ncbi:multiple epidermal growth factor-like domains protein 11 [Mya arenaria]|uniref:multiple epidermal growth factor-like domains protein 11 n=1 Tax=Mya arenaria TaxID=6604 RepID=UPI0022E0C589|nr:multiple epidermal growth factor-like domains protein 11 [Mya arenaria]
MYSVFFALIAMSVLRGSSETEFGELVTGKARQSSTYHECTADKAQDGIKIFYESTSNCTCSVTRNINGYAFWEIDLSAQHYIEHIAVTGRTDHQQSRNLVAYIGYSQLGYLPSTKQLNDPDKSKIGLDIYLDPPRPARYINIQKSDIIDVMTLCEVEVFKTECPCQQFGVKCKRYCHCTTPTCCDSVYGQCQQCEPGWIPPTCETECEKGAYGQDCSQTCNLNCLYNHCDAVTGSKCVEGCQPGYDFSSSEDCYDECQSGFYGDCSQKCGNCKFQACNKVNGHCEEGCDVGFTGERCQLACSKGTYGDHCSGTCSSFCYNDRQCDHITGFCGRGCVPGYDYNMDPQCNYPCKDGTYGANCTHVCGHCGNEKACEKRTGQCTNGCDLGFSGRMCKEPCVNGYFGYNCSSPCHCNGSDFKCDTRYGNCSNGCSFGYGGFNCSIGCIPSSWFFTKY